MNRKTNRILSILAALALALAGAALPAFAQSAPQGAQKPVTLKVGEIGRAHV